MGERIVNIKIQAAADGAVRGFAAVRDAAAEAKTKLEESAQNQRQAWATVGQGLTAVGVAITGVGVAALKTGVQYNTLQQTTRAALTTLLGSAEAANAQMNKLDDFARNSPFAKQTFITAQQQMLAFGIETSKVIPYLDSVQNAVAAMGGSNQQIAEISFIMSQISSASKITAQDLMQFGQRGLNAAELIGSQMGKTGAQIREDITAGALDADQALDALSAGMAAKFDGAAANVKNTFEGAMDRVKAAWRDFSSELARPLVDPDGGGALIDLLNWAADAMRAFQDLPEPVKNTTTALGGLAGAGALMTGTAMLALPKWLEFQDALKSLGGIAGIAKGGLSNIVTLLSNPWVIAVAGAVTALYLFQSAIAAVQTSSADLTSAMESGKSAFEVMGNNAVEAEEKFRVVTVSISDHLKDLPALFDDAAVAGEGFWNWATGGPQLSATQSAAMGAIEEFGTALSGLAENDLPRAQDEFRRFYQEAGLNGEQAITALNETMPEFKQQLLDAARAAGVATDDWSLLAIALGDTDVASMLTTESLEEISGTAVDVTESIATLVDEIIKFGSAQMDSERASLAFEEQLSKLNARVEEGHVGLDKNTEAGRENIKSLLDMAEATNKSAGETWKATGNQEEANAVLGRGRDALIKAAEAYGYSSEEAAAYADQLIATPEVIATRMELDTQAARAALDSFISTANGAVISPMIRAIQQRASGGTIGFARGGTIPGYAGGSTVGIGGGVTDGTVWGRGTSKSDSITVNLSKGEEVIQEPYASLNRPLLKAINRGDFSPSMMQPQVVMRGSSGPTVVSLAGATLKATLDGRPITLMIDEQIAAATADVSGAALTSSLGARVAR